MMSEMKMITASELRADIKKGLHGVYLFCGPEEYMISAYTDMVQQSVTGGDETAQTFSVLSIDCSKEQGGSGQPEHGELLMYASTLPMLTERKLITVTGTDFSALSGSSLDSFCSLCDSLAEFEYLAVIFIADEDELDTSSLPRRPSAAMRRLSEHLGFVFFERQTPAKLAAWCAKHLRAYGISARPELCRMLCERCGGSMRIIASETDKLGAYLCYRGSSELTADDIIACCPVADAEEGPFAMSNAILSFDREGMMRVYFDLKDRRVRPEMILSQISAVWCDLAVISALASSGRTRSQISSELGMHEFRVGKYLDALGRMRDGAPERAIGLLLDADTAIKQSGGDQYVILEQMIAGLCRC